MWNIPFVVSFHGWDFSQFPRLYGRDVYHRLFKIVDTVTVNSEYTRGRLKELGCPPQKMRKLFVGLNPDDFPFCERTPQPGKPVNILTVARLEEIKGYEYAIRAVAKVREKHPEVRYDIVGDGPQRQNMEELIHELGMDEAVTLHGSQDSLEVRKMMAEAHLFVLSSVSVGGDQEGQGLVLQEAQGSGLPVVATDHGALPEGIVPGQSGFLVPERDIKSLAERLTYLIPS